MSCTSQTRKIVTLDVAAGSHEDYAFTALPAADPLLTIVNGPAAGRVGVSVSADGQLFVPIEGAFVTLGADEGLLVPIPRSAAAVRLEATAAATGVMVVVTDT